MVNSPEIPGGKGTYASTGNYIPLMQAAPAGMRHRGRPAPAALLGAHGLRGVSAMADDTHAREGDWVEVEATLLDPADRSSEPAARDGGEAAA